MASRKTTIVVPGGQRGPKLPPARELGVPDPEIGRAIAEGQSRYHLHTLGELQAEADAAKANSLASLVENAAAE